MQTLFRHCGSVPGTLKCFTRERFRTSLSENIRMPRSCSNVTLTLHLGRPSRRRFRTPPARSNVTSKLHLGRPGFEGHIYYFFRLRGMLYHGRKKEARGPGQKKGGQNVPSKTADKIAVEKWGSQWFPLAGEKCWQLLPAIGDGRGRRVNLQDSQRF